MTYKFITVERDMDVTVVTLAREDRRNAIGDAMLAEIEQVFKEPPEGTRCFVLAAQGPHFCAGLDLREHHDKKRTPIEFMKMCQNWHRTFDLIQFGGIPVVAALTGVVVGGGLELAAATHVRIAGSSTFFCPSRRPARYLYRRRCDCACRSDHHSGPHGRFDAVGPHL